MKLVSPLLSSPLMKKGGGKKTMQFKETFSIFCTHRQYCVEFNCEFDSYSFMDVIFKSRHAACLNINGTNGEREDPAEVGAEERRWGREWVWAPQEALVMGLYFLRRVHCPVE